VTINIPDNLTSPEAVEYAIRAAIAQKAYEHQLREEIRVHRQRQVLREIAQAREAARC
jgi:hypothetical protein